MTKQENFWSGEFGTHYIERNSILDLDNNKRIFTKMLQKSSNIDEICEFGCNIGMNLTTLKELGFTNLTGIEINSQACDIARKQNFKNIINASISENLDIGYRFDLVFTFGVLIHINPKVIKSTLQNMVKATKKYILIAEYYSPKLLEVRYREEDELLFKNDFAGQLINEFDCKLIDYGFFYHLDSTTRADDINWFLLST